MTPNTLPFLLPVLRPFDPDPVLGPAQCLDVNTVLSRIEVEGDPEAVGPERLAPGASGTMEENLPPVTRALCPELLLQLLIERNLFGLRPAQDGVVRDEFALGLGQGFVAQLAEVRDVVELRGRLFSEPD